MNEEEKNMKIKEKVTELLKEMTGLGDELEFILELKTYTTENGYTTIFIRTCSNRFHLNHLTNTKESIITSLLNS